MKRKRFTEEHIITVLREHEEPGDLTRRHEISAATLYNWKVKHRGMDVSDAKRLKALEDENAKLKKLLALDAGSGRAEGASVKMVVPAVKHEAVAYLQVMIVLSDR